MSSLSFRSKPNAAEVTPGQFYDYDAIYDLKNIYKSHEYMNMHVYLSFSIRVDMIVYF